MADSIKINKLEIENVKRIKAVKIEPTKNGLTIVGGNNNQGKTSVLDSIAWALGGDRYKPSNATRDGSTIPPNLHIVMSNGLVVERKGKNSSLKVTDPNGNKGGQQLLNDFVEQLALDLPKFMESSGKEKAQTLLKIIGVGDQLTALEQQEKELYNERLYVGRTADQKVKFAKEQPYYPDAPKDLVSPSDLIKQQQEILARNGKNEEYRRNAVNMKAEYDSLNMEIENLRKMLQEKMERHEALSEALEAANKTVSELHDESTAELEASIANIEEINRKVRANLDKDKAEEDAKAYQDQYNELTKKIEDVRDQKTELLNAADLPLPELSVKEGELVYKGQQWDNMSGSDRLKVSTAIVRKLNPKCGFVLLDKLEQMDLVTLNEFGQWLEQEGLQAIATRVSTGDECSIIIEDGYVVKDLEAGKAEAPAAPTWKAGVFNGNYERKNPESKKVVIYGPEGIGKSTFAARFPGAVFIDTEGSTNDMDVARLPRPTSWNMLFDEIEYIKTHTDECRTLVIDTVDWAELLCVEHICAVHNKKGIEDFGYGNGYVYTKEEFGRFLNKLSDLIEVGINVVLTAHAQLRKFEQPDELGAYDRWELKLGKKTQSQTSPLVKEWADMLLFANYKTFSVAVGKDGKKHKGQGGKRTMYTQHHPCWDAKNRFGLPEECEFDYSVIAEIIEGTKKSVPAPKEEKPIEIQKPPVKDNDFMNIPKDTDEKVDFDTGAKIEEPVKSTGKKVEDSVFHIADYIPKALRDLMYPNLVSEEELMEAVYQRGFFPKGTPFQNLPQEFVDGCLIGAWPQVLDVIKTMRSHYDIPFDK